MTGSTTRSSFRTPERYGWLPQFLHWSLASVVMLLLGVSAAFLVPGVVPSKLRGLHQSLGLTLWGLEMLLLLWRVFGHAPGPESSRFSWQIATSSMVGVVLYALLSVVPPIGYLAASLRGDRVLLLGTTSLPALPLPVRIDWMLWLAGSHRILAWCLLACLVIHVGIALYHHLVVRDRMLRRMLPRWLRR